MSSYASSRGGNGGGGNAASNTNTENRELENAVRNLSDCLSTYTSGLELKSAFEDVGIGKAFYYVHEKDGVLLNTKKITREDETTVSVNGKKKTQSAFLNDVRTYSVDGIFTTSKPNTSSKFSIEKKVSKTVGGMELHKGTYDIIGEKNSQTRKFSQNGLIGTYDGERYGIAKSENGYKVTHIDSGLSLGKSQKTYEDAVKQIKSASGHVKNISASEMSKRKEKLANTIRGKE